MRDNKNYQIQVKVKLFMLSKKIGQIANSYPYYIIAKLKIYLKISSQANILNIILAKNKKI
jgi:hypothetical protein